jgi:hypothetical protein
LRYYRAIIAMSVWFDLVTMEFEAFMSFFGRRQILFTNGIAGKYERAFPLFT